jgi:hypothetical protein
MVTGGPVFLGIQTSFPDIKTSDDFGSNTVFEALKTSVAISSTDLGSQSISTPWRTRQLK